MNKPVAQNPPGMLDQGEQKEHNCCFNFFCWFFQIGVWLAIAALIAVFIMKSEESIKPKIHLFEYDIIFLLFQKYL